VDVTSLLWYSRNTKGTAFTLKKAYVLGTRRGLTFQLKYKRAYLKVSGLSR